ncbi:MAG: LysM peptidoglycan-binding domain-containing protein [Anaeromyxobacter sp.]
MKVQEGRVLRQLVVDGNVLGVYGQGTDPNDPTKDGNPNYTVQGSFGLTYQAITNAYPSAAVGTYAVRAGDSLRSVALAAYGDASLWYVIGDANGVRSDAELRVGQTLIIPSSAAGSRNNSGTFQPYDPSKVVGNTSPNLPAPAATSQSNACGVIGIILAVVVTIVATVVTAGAAAIAMGAVSASAGVFGAGAAVVGGSAIAGAASLTTAAMLVGAAALGGAVGSAAGQLTGMAFGLQKEFDWGAVAMGAIGSSVSAVTGAAFSIVKTADVVTTSALAALRASVANAGTQGIACLAHLQENFDWWNVAAASVGGAVGSATAAGMDWAQGYDASKGYDFGKAFLTASVSGVVAGTATSLARQGKVEFVQVAADAFGNALANGLVTAVKEAWQAPWEPQTEAQKAAYEDARDQLLAAGTAADKADDDARKIAQMVAVREQLEALERELAAHPDPKLQAKLDAFKPVFERALLCTDVYFDEAVEALLPEGYQRLGDRELANLNLSNEDLRNDGSGYAAAVYRAPGGRLIMTDRGTESGVDWWNNLTQGAGLSAEQYDRAIVAGRKLVAAVGVENVSFTGHSLGGGLASAQALATGATAVTFNAAGVHEATLAPYGVNRDRAGELVDAYFVKGEVLSTGQDVIEWGLAAGVAGGLLAATGGLGGFGLPLVYSGGSLFGGIPTAAGERFGFEAVRPPTLGSDGGLALGQPVSWFDMLSPLEMVNQHMMDNVVFGMWSAFSQGTWGN